MALSPHIMPPMPEGATMPPGPDGKPMQVIPLEELLTSGKPEKLDQK